MAAGTIESVQLVRRMRNRLYFNLAVQWSSWRVRDGRQRRLCAPAGHIARTPRQLSAPAAFLNSLGAAGVTRCDRNCAAAFNLGITMRQGFLLRMYERKFLARYPASRGAYHVANVRYRSRDLHVDRGDCGGVACFGDVALNYVRPSAALVADPNQHGDPLALTARYALRCRGGATARRCAKHPQNDPSPD